MKVSEVIQLELPLEPPRRRLARATTPIRRCVRRVRLEPDADGTYVFRARSFSRRRGRVYRCKVNPRTGYVFCNCRDFMYRKGPLNPTMNGGPHCKHLARAVRTVQKVEREHALTELPAAA